jgi:integrase
MDDDYDLDKPRYVQRFQRSNGRIFYRYNPPQCAIDAGLLERCMLDRRKEKAYAQAKKYNAMLDVWRDEQREKLGIVSGKDRSFVGLVSAYKQSNEFTTLNAVTQQQYDYWLRLASQRLGDKAKFDSLSGAQVTDVYNAIANDNGVVLANRVLAVCRRMYSYAIRMDFVSDNPWRKVRSRKEESRRVIWSQEDVQKFLEVAYSEWETRSIGLIAQMCYEWCQRVGDMRLLTWDNINFEEGYVTLVQSKRRAQVKIPISDNLLEMLKQQNGALDFQPLVAPNVVDKLKPFNMHRISGWVNRVKEKAGLPSELRLADLRRTGTTEMVEAGVSLPQIMAVTGHSTPNSVTPYMKNSLLSATEACRLRSTHGR